MPRQIRSTSVTTCPSSLWQGRANGDKRPPTRRAPARRGRAILREADRLVRLGRYGRDGRGGLEGRGGRRVIRSSHGEGSDIQTRKVSFQVVVGGLVRVCESSMLCRFMISLAGP